MSESGSHPRRRCLREWGRQLGASGFEEKVAGLARIHLVQRGGELAYFLLHDPEYRGVRREHLVAVGKRIRLKQNIRLLSRIVENSIDGYRFRFMSYLAAPEEVIQSALEGIIPGITFMGPAFNMTCRPVRFSLSSAFAPATEKLL